jgi:hypothetical protein
MRASVDGYSVPARFVCVCVFVGVCARARACVCMCVCARVRLCEENDDFCFQTDAHVDLKMEPASPELQGA